MNNEKIDDNDMIGDGKNAIDFVRWIQDDEYLYDAGRR